MVMIADLSLSIGLLVILSATVNATPYLIFFGGLLSILPDTMWMQFFLEGKVNLQESKEPYKPYPQIPSWDSVE
jgi:hypothetical protein